MIYRVSRKISGGQGFGEIEVNRRSTEGIRAVKVLCRISWWWSVSWHIQSLSTYIIKSGP